MKKSILSLLLACFLQINLAFAQNVMKGVVSDANGPLVGVVIHDKDNAKGTTSDMSGKYALNGAESGHTIEFRYLGYVTETVVWDGKSAVNMKLKEDAVRVELHGVSHNVGNFVISSVVQTLHGMQDTSLNRL